MEFAQQVIEMTRMTTEGFKAINTRLIRIEEKLENHIKVPSWWNKQTDKRLDELESRLDALEDTVNYGD